MKIVDKIKEITSSSIEWSGYDEVGEFLRIILYPDFWIYQDEKLITKERYPIPFEELKNRMGIFYGFSYNDDFVEKARLYNIRWGLTKKLKRI